MFVLLCSCDNAWMSSVSVTPDKPSTPPRDDGNNDSSMGTGGVIPSAAVIASHTEGTHIPPIASTGLSLSALVEKASAVDNSHHNDGDNIGVSVSLSWRNLCYSVPDRRQLPVGTPLSADKVGQKRTRIVVDHVNGIVQPGQMLAILGSSGISICIYVSMYAMHA
jgi:hypothetical protein